jgi:hypothetical protein
LMFEEAADHLLRLFAIGAARHHGFGLLRRVIVPRLPARTRKRCGWERSCRPAA